MKFWQKPFWDHLIRDDRDFENHLHYIHFNPARHGFVTNPRYWKDSSYVEGKNAICIHPLLLGMSQEILSGVSSSSLGDVCGMPI